MAAHEGRACAWAGVVEQTQRRGIGIVQDLAMVLGKVAEAHLVSPARLPGVGGQATHQDLQQRGLAEAVGTDNADALAPAQNQVHIRQHAMVAVGFGQFLDGQHVPAARPLLLEAQHGRAARAAHQFFHLDAFYLF